jgi:S1-C subfamily serine protease
MRKQADKLNETPATRIQTNNESDAELYFKKQLATYEAAKPRPDPCFFGARYEGNLYLVNLTGSAEQGGLLRGDQLTAIAGVPTGAAQDVYAALRKVPPGGPLVVEVKRGGQSVTASLPCRDHSVLWATFRESLAAGADGRWDDCIAGLERSSALAGYIDQPVPLLHERLRCMSAKNSSRGSTDGPPEANLVYNMSLQMLKDSHYFPDGLDQARGAILTNISLLRGNGAANLASDLEAQLQKAGGADSQGKSPPASVNGHTVKTGTALIVRPDGTLLSAFHVVKGSTSIQVACPGLPPAPATVEATGANNDLVVLRIATPTPAYLSLAKPRSVHVGDAVFTVGYPVTAILGKEAKFTDGSISALSGPGGEAMFLQISVPIQPGNSGGPLVTGDGHVIGIVTATAAVRAFLATAGTLPQNINWAVKSDYALPLFDPPADQPIAKSRSEAIERTMKATCQVEAQSGNL